MKVELVGLEQLRRNLTLLEREVFPKAMARTLNRGGRKVRTHTVRHVAKAMGLKQKDVRPNVKVRTTTPAQIDRGVTVHIRGGALNLIRFKATQLKKGVKASPWGNRRLFRSAFIVRDKAVMRREGRGSGFVGRLPIEPMRGPGIAKTAASDEVSEGRRKLIADFVPTEFRRQLDLLVSRLRA